MFLHTNPELFWLLLSVLATALMWIPHILQLIFQEGLFPAIYDPARETEHKARWAQRARRAHMNAIENLVIFAPLVLIINQTGMATELTAVSAMIFFFARIGHFLAYSFAIPIVRVLFFLLGWACQIVLGCRLLGWL